MAAARHERDDRRQLELIVQLVALGRPRSRRQGDISGLRKLRPVCDVRRSGVGRTSLLQRTEDFRRQHALRRRQRRGVDAAGGQHALQLRDIRASYDVVKHEGAVCVLLRHGFNSRRLPVHRQLRAHRVPLRPLREEFRRDARQRPVAEQNQLRDGRDMLLRRASALRPDEQRLVVYGRVAVPLAGFHRSCAPRRHVGCMYRGFAARRVLEAHIPGRDD